MSNTLSYFITKIENCMLYTGNKYWLLYLRKGIAYYTQETNINISSGYVYNHIQASMTEWKLYLCFTQMSNTLLSFIIKIVYCMLYPGNKYYLLYLRKGIAYYTQETNINHIKASMTKWKLYLRFTLMSNTLSSFIAKIGNCMLYTGNKY